MKIKIWKSKNVVENLNRTKWRQKMLGCLITMALAGSILTGCGSQTADGGNKYDIASDSRSYENNSESSYSDTGSEEIMDSTNNINDSSVSGGEIEQGVDENLYGAEIAEDSISSSVQKRALDLTNGLYDSLGDEARTGCPEYPMPETYAPEYKSSNTEEYNALEEMGFMATALNPLSTFSADVDTASYSNLRRMIEDGYSLEDIPEGSVRIEELLNYFSYDYKKPGKGEPFGVTTQIADCPWNSNTKIAMVGLKTKDVDFSEASASNLVFLIDVSGSMYSDDKLPLLQQAFGLLTENLTAKDTVSIVVYAGEDRVILEGKKGTDKKGILNAINDLEAGGSTAGSDGIITAYKIARKYYIEGGNNRIILATDGDLNVGLTTEEELENLITQEKKTGVYLSVLGFGTGNIKDNKMETLADKGNGNYAYIDSLTEARKVLVEEIGSTLVTVAEDVKFQVEFNPDVVAGYRLIGYENRQLAEQDFADDTKDAGEVGAGHTVTVLYEIVTVDAQATYSGTTLKYGQSQRIPAGKEWFTVNIRYKKPGKPKSILLDYPIGSESYKKVPGQDLRFAMAVAEFGLVVNDSSYKGDATLQTVLERLSEMDTKGDEYKDEFCNLVRMLEGTYMTRCY